MSGLTHKQLLFAQRYVVHLNARRAATEAGFSPRSAQQQASRLLSYAKVQKQIREEMEARSERTRIDADLVLNDLEQIKRSAMAEVPDKEGQPRMKNYNAALKAAELQGRHLGLFSPELWEDEEGDVKPYYDPDPEV